MTYWAEKEKLINIIVVFAKVEKKWQWWYRFFYVENCRGSMEDFL